MNCQTAQPLLSAERDGALTSDQRTALAAHLQGCAACRQWQQELAAAMTAVRAEAERFPAPDADEQWRLLRAELGAPAVRRSPVAWFALPLAAAAALAVAFFIGRPAPHAPLATPTAELARADFVEVADASASPLVYVDKESGWLVVWAVEGEAHSG